MDPIVANIAVQIPMAVLIFIVTDRLNRAHAAERTALLVASVEERKQQREWFDSLVVGFGRLVETNTDALRANTITLGEANAARFACPVGAFDAEGHRFSRRRANGDAEDERP